MVERIPAPPAPPAPPADLALLADLAVPTASTPRGLEPRPRSRFSPLPSGDHQGTLIQHGFKQGAQSAHRPIQTSAKSSISCPSPTSRDTRPAMAAKIRGPI